MAMIIAKVSQYADSAMMNVISKMKWIILLFFIDAAITITFKMWILGLDITVNDFLIPGLLGGIVFRLVEMGFNLVFFLLYLIGSIFEPMLKMGFTFDQSIAEITAFFMGIVQLIFTDIIGFFAKYLGEFDIAELFQRIIVDGLLIRIQALSNIPVYDFYMSVIEPVFDAAGNVVTPFLNLYIEMHMVPLYIAETVVLFFIGGVSYEIAHIAAGAFADYSIGGILKGNQGGTVRRSDILDDKQVYRYLNPKSITGLPSPEFESDTVPRDPDGTLQTRLKPVFKSTEAKQRWMNIQAGLEKQQPFDETVTKRVHIFGTDDPPQYRYETETKTFTDAPYLKPAEEASILERIGQRAYSFFRWGMHR